MATPAEEPRVETRIILLNSQASKGEGPQGSITLVSRHSVEDDFLLDTLYKYAEGGSSQTVGRGASAASTCSAIANFDVALFTGSRTLFFPRRAYRPIDHDADAMGRESRPRQAFG